MDKPVRYREIAHLPLGDRIDLVCDAFEAERRRGLFRPVEDYVEEVPEPEREAFLSELRTVEQALSNASTVMEGEPIPGRPIPGRVAEGEPTRSLARSPDDPPEPTVPRQLGRYEVEELLGRGGFGEVWKCLDPQLKRYVAVKVLLRERFASDQEVARFMAEATKLAQLRHPGIVAVYDAGSQGGYVYLVSEYVPGGTLHDRLQKGPLPPAEAAELLAKVAEAVHYAHKRGLVHRDLKPGNILIDADGQPRVADFGLAVHEDEQRRRAGEIAGTPAYMSPEQVRGETHLLDGRADIWAIGVILYQCLTRRRPFNGDTREDVFYDILHRAPKPPRQLDERIPQELELICLGCLQKLPSDRPSSAADVFRRYHSHSTSRFRAATKLACILVTAIALAIGIVFVLSRTPNGPSRDTNSEPLFTASNQWVPFLDRTRRRVLYDSQSPSSVDHFSPENVYHFAHGTLALVAFGDVAADDLELRMSVSLRDWLGYAGFFWALREDQDAFAGQEMKCYAIDFGRLNQATNRLRVRIAELTISKDERGVSNIRSREELTAATISIPVEREVLCRIASANGEVIRVSFATINPKTGATNEEAVAFARPAKVAWPRDRQTQFGLLCNFGVASFRNAALRCNLR